MTLVILGTLMLFVALALHAVLVAPGSLRTTVIDAPLEGLSPAFDGYTLAVLADLHHREPGGGRHLRRIIAAANAASPDLVVLLGDYGVSFKHNRRLSTAAYQRALPALGRELHRLRSRDGLVAVLGNHDHYYDAGRTAEWLGALDARVLMNDHVVIHRNGASLIVSGTGDALEGEVDPMAGVCDRSTGIPIVVLAHNPDAVLSLSCSADIGLVLSGHTHGGQIVIPGYGAPVTLSKICGRRTASGWVSTGIAPLYVTRGAGSQFPVRFRCPPEVLIVRLRLSQNQHPV